MSYDKMHKLTIALNYSLIIHQNQVANKKVMRIVVISFINRLHDNNDSDVSNQFLCARSTVRSS